MALLPVLVLFFVRNERRRTQPADLPGAWPDFLGAATLGHVAGLHAVGDALGGLVAALAQQSTHPHALRIADTLREAAERTGIPAATCRAYLGDLDYDFSYRHLAGLTEFFGRLAKDGLVPDSSLTFLTAA